jgi:hypothetical protein
MRKLRLPILAAAATIGLAGAAIAATAHNHTMNVTLPDGSIAQISYTGDVAPTLRLVPVEAVPAEAAAAERIAYDPFAEMDRMFTAMEQRQAAMMQQVAEMQRAAQSQAATGAPGLVTASTGRPANGVVSYSYVSQTTTGADGCTRTVEWRSDGSQAQPVVTKASSGHCDKASPAPEKVTRPVGPIQKVPADTI